MSDDYWDEPSRWFDGDGMPTTPIGLYGVTRRFAMGSERWDYYHSLHLEKSKESYSPYKYLKELTNERD